MRPDDLLRLAENIRAELLPRFPEISDVRFSINTRIRRVLGRANFRSKEVELSAASYVEISLNDHLANNTIRHELAHIVAYHRYQDDGHGTAWKSTARSMGCTGDRCSAGAKTGDEIRVACDCGWGVEVSERKCRMWHRKGRALQCQSCRKLVWYPWEKKVWPVTRNLVQRG